MAKYRLLKAHFLNNRHYLAGEKIDWKGVPSVHMEPLDADGRKAVEARKASRPVAPKGREPGAEPAQIGALAARGKSMSPVTLKAIVKKPPAEPADAQARATAA